MCRIVIELVGWYSYLRHTKVMNADQPFIDEQIKAMGVVEQCL